MFCLLVTESVLLPLGRCKCRTDVSVVCVITAVSRGNNLGSFDTAIWYAGPSLRRTEVTSCTSLLCVVSVSMVNRALYPTQCRGAEVECRIWDRAR